MRFWYIFVFIILSSCSGLKHKSNFANKVIAHRGAWKQNGLPFNSIASLRQAVQLGCAGSEFDVRMTLDSVLVINHDPAYKGLVIEKTKYRELLKFQLSNGEKLPTLKEYLRAGMKNNKATGLICEIKPSKNKARGKYITHKVLALVDSLKANAYVSSYISFDYQILKEVSKINDRANTQYLGGNKTPDELKADGISGLDYYMKVYKDHPEYIKRAKELGLVLNVWTVNNSEDLDWFLARDIDFITTNEPELLLEKEGKLRDLSGVH